MVVQAKASVGQGPSSRARYPNLVPRLVQDGFKGLCARPYTGKVTRQGVPAGGAVVALPVVL